MKKTGEIPQVLFLDRLMTPVVVRRLVPGRDRAENCGGSAVACSDKVVDVPVVQVPQFIDGLDVAVIMQRLVVSNSGSASDSVHRQSLQTFQFAAEMGTHRANCAAFRRLATMKGVLAVFRIFRAPLGCPGVERQFSESSMAKSSLSSSSPLPISFRVVST